MYKQYINGELVQGAGVRVKVLDPADNSVIEELDTASEEQCLAALEAAQAAFKDWKMGYACALAVVLLVFVLIVNLIQDLFFKEKTPKKGAGK